MLCSLFENSSDSISDLWAFVREPGGGSEGEDAAEVRPARIGATVSWRAAEWDSKPIPDTLSAQLANWFASPPGRNVLGNIEKIVTEAARQERLAVSVQMESWPRNEKRWGPNNVFRILHEGLPMGIFPASPKLFGIALKLSAFSINLAKHDGEMFELTIGW